MGLRRWALGFFTPFWWLFHEMCAMASLTFSMGTLYLAEYAVASCANMPGAVALGPIIACCWPKAGESGRPP
jgi:hypothetical protein